MVEAAPQMSDTGPTLRAAAAGLLVAFGAAGAFVWVERSGAPAASEPGTARPPAPDFALGTPSGATVRLSELRGHVVLVDFWATWCGPCREELPVLVALAQRLEGQGVRLVAVSEDDPPEQAPAVQAFAATVPGLERSVVYGDPDLERRYGVTSLPTLFVLDRQGRLVRKLVGFRGEAEVLAAVEAALRER